MLDPTQLENAILRIINDVSPDNWLPLTLGTLRNRLSEVRTDLGLAKEAVVVDCICSLEARSLIGIRKSENLTNVPFARTRVIEDPYRIQFFWHSSFELKITHEGRKFIAQKESQPKEVSTGATDEMDDRLPLYRQKVFDADLERLAQESLRSELPLALVMIDVDNFKQFNDSHGYLTGTEVLLTVSTVIAKRSQGKGRAYRYGGDEMTILLVNYSKPEAITLAETLRIQVEELAVTAKKLKVTITLGVASLPEDARDGKSLFNAANEVLVRGKKLGGNLVRAVGDIDEVKGSRVIQRKQPVSRALTDEEQVEIRRAHFRGQRPECPRDGTLLRVRESNEVGCTTPTLLVICPECGIQEFLSGASR
jgi:diguanylate cyclase (GGDEF)-like protein